MEYVLCEGHLSAIRIAERKHSAVEDAPSRRVVLVKERRAESRGAQWMLPNRPVAGVQIVYRLFDQISARLGDVEIPVSGRALMIQIRGGMTLRLHHHNVTDFALADLVNGLAELLDRPKLLSGDEDSL